MAEIVNLRRARKAKARADHAAEAEADRIRHGLPKAERDLAKARQRKAEAELDASRIDKDSKS